MNIGWTGLSALSRRRRVPLRLPQRSVADLETSIALCSSREENDDLSTRVN